MSSGPAPDIILAEETMYFMHVSASPGPCTVHQGRDMHAVTCVTITRVTPSMGEDVQSLSALQSPWTGR